MGLSHHGPFSYISKVMWNPAVKKIRKPFCRDNDPLSHISCGLGVDPICKMVSVIGNSRPCFVSAGAGISHPDPRCGVAFPRSADDSLCCYLWDKACPPLNNNHCQCGHEGEQFASGQFCVFPHEGLVQEQVAVHIQHVSRDRNKAGALLQILIFCMCWQLKSVYLLTGCSLFLDAITSLILFRSSACNIALKLLAPKLDKLSYRYSKVIRIGGYFGKWFSDQKTFTSKIHSWNIKSFWRNMTFFVSVRN